jgi:hypothetical protein
MTKAATAMVIADGIAAHLVLKPMMMNIGATTSPISARINVAVSPKPIGSANFIGLSNRYLNFGIPWVKRNPPKPIRRMSSARLFKLFFI